MTSSQGENMRTISEVNRKAIIDMFNMHTGVLKEEHIIHSTG